MWGGTISEFRKDTEPLDDIRWAWHNGYGFSCLIGVQMATPTQLVINVAGEAVVG